MNVAVIMGRLTDTPELRTTPSGVSVTSFTLAVNRAFVKAGAERQADFIDCVAWRQTAEFICKYFKKGQMMALKGSIQTRTYTDKEGHNRKAMEILADNVYFTESRNPNQSTAPSAAAPSPARHDAAASEPVAFSSGNDGDFAVIEGDEDLPF